jgi:hypothetical protein
MLLVVAIATAIAILVSAVVQSRLMSVEPETRQHIAAQAQSGRIERPPIAVNIEPARIEVIGKRRSSVFETLADWLSRSGDAS